jgi:hypothetical protein
MNTKNWSERGWSWFSELQYAGGGVKLAKPRLGGTVYFSDVDPVLVFNVEDGYYSGTMNREDALNLAHMIIKRLG